MDTRTKIVSLAQAQRKLKEGNWLIIAGNFDPLTATVAQRIESLVRQHFTVRVLIAIFENPGSLLTSGERSILMASLRTVENVVVISPDTLATLSVDSIRVRCVVDLEAERRNSDDFAELILRKERSSVRVGGAAS